jgi:hypothetical protein
VATEAKEQKAAKAKAHKAKTHKVAKKNSKAPKPAAADAKTPG